MKIDQLIYFVETAKHEHIRKASKILGISPSAISHSISALEGELGVKLFQKQGKFIVLSKEGTKLLERCEDLITGFQNLKSELLDDSSEKHHYRIGASHTVSAKLVTPVWANICKTYSNTSVELFTLRSADVLQQVVNKQLDCGVLFSPNDHPDIEQRAIRRGELLLVVNKKHPLLKHKKDEQLKKISDFPAVLPKAFEGIELCIQNPIFKKFKISPNPKTVVDSYDTAMELIKHTNHWGLIPDFILNYFGNDYKVVKPLKGWSAPYHLSIIWHKKQFIPQFFTIFENELRDLAL